MMSRPDVLTSILPRGMCREFHYWPDAGRSEHWEYSAATGWRKAPKGEGEDWPGDTYEMRRWGINDKPEARNGRPPRIYI